MAKPMEKYVAFAFGVVFVVVLLVLATQYPNPTPFQYTVFRIVLALAAGGVAAMIPGFLTVQVSNAIRAGGALAVFLIAYFYSPAELVGVKVKSEQELEVEKPVVLLSPSQSTGASVLQSAVPLSNANAQSSKRLPSLTVTSSSQFGDSETISARYEALTIDGAKVQIPSGATIVANEIVGVRGGALIGTDFSIVARRLANIKVDISAARAPEAVAGTVRIYAKLVENTTVLAGGAQGSNGLPGAAGTNGADGASGRDGRCDGFGRWRAAQAGGNGGDAGSGSDGATGGDGGPGGVIILTTVISPVSSSFDVAGGLAGRGGPGGVAGSPGRGGTGGRGCTGLGGSQENNADGRPGRPGQPGQPGPSGRPGTAGEYRLLLVRSFDPIVARLTSLSNGQLHSALAVP
jgi:hypothetical protein